MKSVNAGLEKGVLMGVFPQGVSRIQGVCASGWPLKEALREENTSRSSWFVCY
jgi:hypothetical protein